MTAPAPLSPSTPADNQFGSPPPAHPDRLLVAAVDAAALCGVSRATWLRQHSAGRVPAPVRIGRRTLWRLDELRAWIDAGCPDRDTWQTIRTTGRRPLRLQN
jgi:predicted DNA-binding transcriptional regulator AlpA